MWLCECVRFALWMLMNRAHWMCNLFTATTNPNEMRWRQFLFIRCVSLRIFLYMSKLSGTDFGHFEIDMFLTRFRLSIFVVCVFVVCMYLCAYRLPAHMLPAKCVSFDLHFHLMWLKIDQIKPECVIVYSVRVLCYVGDGFQCTVISSITTQRF